jgi:surface carbohydrate biosynthesis protein
MKNVLNFFLIVIKIKLEFKFIKKKDLLIYDEYTADYARPFFKESVAEFLDIRYNKINLAILLKSLLSKITRKELTLSQIYILNYIEQTSPKCVITFQDQHNFFWRLKEYFPKIKFIIVQSSVMAPWYISSIYNLKKNKINNKKYKIDFFFVYGQSYKRVFSKYFDSEFIILGSFRNNIVDNLKKNLDDLIFISQFKNQNLKHQLLLQNKKSISAANYFYNADQLVIKFLAEYCKKNKIKLKILLRTTDGNKINLEKEKSYFFELLKFNNYKFEFLNKPKRISTYHLIKKYNYFVTIDSTLGYEALSREKRVAFLFIRKNIANILSYENYKFGWPNIYPDNKYFWTNSSDSKHMKNALNYIYHCKELDWKKIIKKFVNSIIIYNCKNEIFFAKMKKIGVNIK